ncbi:MAG: hypothetical protein FJW34_12660 [Acidobacteria bacterium]|nr:hypothetical protein [Acidobacteriota bacterium]
MKTRIPCMLLLAAAALAADPPVNSFARLRDLFPNPPASYRTLPFFVWNGEVTEADIDKYLADFHAQGIGGVFIHPRPGLITPYLSDRWFELCRYTVEQAKKLGMEVWLYDENSYPSGFAGGHVPAEMPESYNEGQGLLLRKTRQLSAEQAAQCKFLLERSGEAFQVIETPATAAGRAGDFYCFELAYYDKRAWHGGFSYVDLIRPGVTEKFIELTMRGYERTLGGEFGKAVPGIFTDEPNIIAPARKDCMRWTPDLFEQFQKRWGYALKPQLASLFEERGEWRKVRHNYYGLLLELFIDRWAKPWYRYSEAKNLLWTGHYWEHGWPSPAHGPDNMAMYAWHHVPGIDMLFNQFAEGVNAQFGNVRAVKELSSIANQLGRRRTLSETYGGAGWELRFEDMKRLGDWEYVLGVNLMNQHLSHQTLVGARKHDYPQSFTYHTPWWPHYRVLADYFGRLSLALATGEQVNRVLVLEPTSSAWLYASSGTAHPRMLEIGKAFQEFLNQLEALHVEYDLGCENTMKDHGRAQGAKLVVGRRVYDLIVLPPGTENLDSPTAKMLTAYLKAGGRILSLVEPPALIDGATSDAFRQAAAAAGVRWVKAADLSAPATRSLLLDGVLVEASGKLFHQRRQLEDGELFFIVNSSLEQPARAVVRLRGRTLHRMDLFRGALSAYPARSAGGRLEFSLELPPAGSLLVVASDSGSASPREAARGGPARPLAPGGPLSVRRLGPNVLTLDYCDLRVGGELDRDTYYYPAAEKAFRLHGFDGNPWNTAVQYKTTILDRNRFAPDSGFEATFFFDVDPGLSTAQLRAVVERPELWKVSLNGKPVSPLAGEWWLDVRFGVYDIAGLVVVGRNAITLSARPMSVHHELEPVYVIGEFGVAARERGWKLVPPQALAVGVWKDQGLPFYADRVAYAREYDLRRSASRIKVALDRWNGTVAEVLVNGKSAGVIGWQPYEADITDHVIDGKNRVEVVVIGSLKNTLGPHHGKINRGLVSPWSFRSAPQHQPAGAAYDLDAYGLLAEFSVVEQ